MTYPEQLAAALHAAGRDDVAVANVGIAGTTVLGSVPTAGINRFGRDVVPLQGLKAVIDYLGANDLRLMIYVATTAPSCFCGSQNPSGFGSRFGEGTGEEAQRFLVVKWELGATTPSSGSAEVADGTVDFNGAIVDPSNRSYMLTSLDSGDDVHPNATGYGLMVKAIPLSLF